MGNVKAYVETSMTGTSRAWVASVNVVVRQGDKTIYYKEFRGSATKHPSDKTKDKIGAELALGRALESAGKRLQKIAWSEVPSHVPSPNHPSMQPGEVLTIVPKKKRRDKTNDTRKKNE